MVQRRPGLTLRTGGFSRLVVDPSTGEIWINREPVSWSLKEQAHFDLRCKNAGRACSKQDIAEVVWPEYQAEVYDYQIESLVKRLREKLEPDPSNPVLALAGMGAATNWSRSECTFPKFCEFWNPCLLWANYWLAAGSILGNLLLSRLC